MWHLSKSLRLLILGLNNCPFLRALGVNLAFRAIVCWCALAHTPLPPPRLADFPHPSLFFLD